MSGIAESLRLLAGRDAPGSVTPIVSGLASPVREPPPPQEVIQRVDMMEVFEHSADESEDGSSDHSVSDLNAVGPAKWYLPRTGWRPF